MSAKKDYYETLGLSKGSSDDQIKQAYRKLAREYHPDMAKDSDKASAEKKFKEINEAYQVLGDPQKKKTYDQFGHAGGANGFNPGAGGFGGFGGSGGQWGPFSYSYSSSNSGDGSGFGNVDPFDVFEDFFGFRGFGGERQPKRGKTLRYEMVLTFAEAVQGVEKTINVESGKVSMKIPAGINDGNEMKFAGKGMAGPNGLPPGDLYISFRVEMPREFERVGEFIKVDAEISFVQAILGDAIEVPIVNPDSSTGISMEKLKIPAGTQSGTQFRIKGKGMPRVNQGGRGDMIIQVFVIIPAKISKKQKELLEQYKKF